MNRHKQKNTNNIATQMILLIVVSSIFLFIAFMFIQLLHIPAFLVELDYSKAGEKNVYPYVRVGSTFDDNVVLKTSTRIKRQEDIIDVYQIPYGYNFVIELGESIKEDDVIAESADENIVCISSGRVVDIVDNNVYVDVYTNYAADLILQLLDIRLYSHIKASIGEKVNVKINDSLSDCMIHSANYNEHTDTYIIKFTEFSYNESIMDEFIVTLEKIFFVGQKYILFPKSCLYEMVDFNRLKAHKIVYEGEEQVICDILFLINLDYFYADYFCAYYDEELVGNFLMNNSDN